MKLLVRSLFLASLACFLACDSEPAANDSGPVTQGDGSDPLVDGSPQRGDGLAPSDGAPPPSDGDPPSDGAPPPPDDASGPKLDVSKQTRILSPTPGAPLVEGQTIELEGQGPGTLKWSYDANSDGLGEVPIDNGATVSFTVPSGIKAPKQLTLMLASDAGKVEQQHPITSGGSPPDSGPPPLADSGPPPADGGPPPAGCKGFVESGGLVVIEVESAPLAGDWSKRTSNAGYTGSGYYEWKYGDSSSGTDKAGGGVLTYDVCVGMTGRYQLHLRAAAPHKTEHNDVWVAFPDTGAVRNKGGADTSLGTGYFKVYENKGGDIWQWQTTTKDNDGHQIFVDVNAVGGFRVQLSGRSTQFKVDRFVLRHSTVDKNDATDTSKAQSAKQ